MFRAAKQADHRRIGVSAPYRVSVRDAVVQTGPGLRVPPGDRSSDERVDDGRPRSMLSFGRVVQSIRLHATPSNLSLFGEG